MITATEARERVKLSLKKQLRKAQRQIRYFAKIGNNSCHLEFPLTQEAIDYLKNLGYSVEKNWLGLYKITWSIDEE